MKTEEMLHEMALMIFAAVVDFSKLNPFDQLQRFMNANAGATSPETREFLRRLFVEYRNSLQQSVTDVR